MKNKFYIIFNYYDYTYKLLTFYYKHNLSIKIFFTNLYSLNYISLVNKVINNIRSNNFINLANS